MGKKSTASTKAHTEKAAQTVTPISKKRFEEELFRLQAELVKVQEWVRAEGQRVVIIFEGRDAAGKGGAIKRVTEYLNPRVPDRGAPRADRTRARAVVLPALHRPPAERRRDRPVRPVLVQPGGRRARHGILHR